jgi:hypothetical protein
MGRQFMNKAYIIAFGAKQILQFSYAKALLAPTT